MNTNPCFDIAHGPGARISTGFRPSAQGGRELRQTLFLRLLYLLAAMLLAAIPSAASTRYVDVNSTGATTPYTSWATAAATIQQAVDAAAPGDEIVVTNGTYATGGRAVGTSLLVNRVAVDKPVALRSVNGPQVTVIRGYQVTGTTNGDGAIRCVYLAEGASLSGFTLTNGATQGGGPGGGVAGGTLYNCIVYFNQAPKGANHPGDQWTTVSIP